MKYEYNKEYKVIELDDFPYDSMPEKVLVKLKNGTVIEENLVSVDLFLEVPRVILIKRFPDQLSNAREVHPDEIETITFIKKG